jgi:hypothetical protein
MPRTRIAALVALVFLAVPAATVHAAPRMPIGFFDDPSFRWAPDRAQNLAAAAAAGATVIHTTANWALIAPTRPTHPADPDDHAYQLGDLDELVRESARYGLRVMIDITGTPRWANGGQTPNHMPKSLNDFATFVRMLALRYDGRNPGKGEVSLWSIWNEPNLNLFLTPQFAGKRIVSVANYAKLYKVAYAAIKSENPYAKVAAGETSARGRDRHIAGQSDTVAPGTFAKLLAKIPGIRFDAWAQHPYPTSRTAPPLEKVKYPNVTLSQLSTFEKSLASEFHRAVPLWITEFGYETKPAQPHGVTMATQVKYARQALMVARNDPNVQMFCWFTFRDNPGNPWKSGLESTNGGPKPSLAPFEYLAHAIDGTTVDMKSGRPAGPVSIFVPYLTFYNPVGSLVGITYRITDNGRLIEAGEPQGNLAPDGSVTFTPRFIPVKGHTYTVTATINDANGNLQTRMASIVAS